MSHDWRMRQLLKQAQAGNEDAARQVALYCFEKYKYRLNKLYSRDPAISLEDMEMTFYEGIQDFVLKADGRGDDFYHIGQRGIWLVMSELRAVHRVMERRAYPQVWDDGEEAEFTDRHMDRTTEDFREHVISVLDAGATVSVIARARLKTRTREALELILSGEVGEPDEIGFNKRLAGRMGISPQRSSQIMDDLEASLWRAQSGYDGDKT